MINNKNPPYQFDIFDKVGFFVPSDTKLNDIELKPAVIKGMSEVMAEMMGMSAEDLAMMEMSTDRDRTKRTDYPRKATYRDKIC